MKRIDIRAVVALTVISLVLFSGCSITDSVDTKNSVDVLVDHISAIIEIVKVNKDDCGRFMKELDVFTKKNSTEAAELIKKVKGKALSPEEAKKLNGKIKEMATASKELSTKCPKESAVFGLVMHVFWELEDAS